MIILIKNPRMPAVRRSKTRHRITLNTLQKVLISTAASLQFWERPGRANPFQPGVLGIAVQSVTGNLQRQQAI